MPSYEQAQHWRTPQQLDAYYFPDVSSAIPLASTPAAGVIRSDATGSSRRDDGELSVPAAFQTLLTAQLCPLHVADDDCGGYTAAAATGAFPYNS